MATTEAVSNDIVDRTRRIEFLEAVRGIAATLVVLQHLLADEFPAYQRWTYHHLDLGRVGVVAFFLVSGYVIPLSLSGQTLRTFATRRFFRLYPSYWVALALYLALHFDEIVRQVGTPGLVLNVLMVHGMVGIVSALPPAWTLSIELIFYLQSAAAKAVRRLDISAYLGLAWLALYLLLCLVEWKTSRAMPTTLPALLFTAGVGHALWLRDRSGSRAWLPLLLAGVVLVPAGAVLGADPDGQWPPFTYSVSFLAGIALFVGCRALRRHEFGRPLLFAGAISYAVYLFHPIVIDILHRRSGLPDGPVFVIVNLLVIPLVGWLVHRLLERPSIETGRRWTRRWVPSASAGSTT
ncbi:acyltransferase family protein [Rugosimonospora africana]|uniref:Acyltransferase n=1 Tax=Rugosimonospora africana TaxID=556532 RepID=A0A8J3QPK9_9ACTN|nr:acyltransferase [Rugosimonospora africana]GIH14089.1 acyltransferase [Rugosimonospora africana]